MGSTPISSTQVFLSKEKQIKSAHNRLQRTVCHVPFGSILPLEILVPFRESVLVAKRG